jgi:hypothetical protein
MVSNGVRPKILSKNSQVFFMQLYDINVQFIDIASFVELTIYEIADRYSLTMSYFPSILNHNRTYNSKPREIPALKYYLNFTDSANVRSKKTTYHSKLSMTQKDWIFNVELANNCSNNSNILMTGVLEYLKDALMMQKLTFSQLKLHSPTNYLSYLHPFTEFVSRNSYVFALFRFCAKLNNLYVVPKENCGYYVRSSHKERDCIYFFMNKYPSKQWEHSWSSQYGQRKISGIYPDLINKEKKIFAFFHGCNVSKNIFQKNRKIEKN